MTRRMPAMQVAPPSLIGNLIQQQRVGRIEVRLGGSARGKIVFASDAKAKLSPWLVVKRTTPDRIACEEKLPIPGIEGDRREFAE